MAIAKMKKLHLVGMAYDKDKILNALHKTGAAEIKWQTDVADTAPIDANTEELSVRIAAVEAALTALVTETENYEKEHDLKPSIEKDGFDVRYSEFVAVKDRRAEAEELIGEIAKLTDRRNSLKGDFAKAKRELELAVIYEDVPCAFSYYKDSAHTRTRIGTVSTTVKSQVLEALQEEALCDVQEISSGENTVLAVYYHKEILAAVDGILSSYAFSDCPYHSDLTGKENVRKAKAVLSHVSAQISELEQGMYALKENIRLLKVYYDYLSFEAEKECSSEKMRKTESTLFLEAYVPEFAESEVSEALCGVSSAMYFEFTEPTDADEPPTLMQNNSVVECFEGITNTFAPPNYRELDPNFIMGLFYSIFMGFIIGDAGYGILMFLVGGYLWWKGLKKPTGMSRLAGAFAVGGIFAIVWGLLFNSLFGFAVFEKAVMPNAQTDMWLLAGISVPAVLIISMLIGVAHLTVGYVCKAVQEWRRGNTWDGIFDGIVWAVFSLGVAALIVGFTEEARLPFLQMVGAVTAGGSLLLAMLTAGRHEKGFGKFTKGFGAAYGVINYASDILSYARLYGLMLSGAVIAGIIAGYAADFFASGNVVFMILAVVLLIVGNGFNLVMNLLGAYIHDARLQYVEFYGKFFEGEGVLFKPLGSECRFISVVKDET